MGATNNAFHAGATYREIGRRIPHRRRSANPNVLLQQVPFAEPDMKRIIGAFLFAALAACPGADLKADAPTQAMTPTRWHAENAESTDTRQRAVRFTVSHATMSAASGKPVCWLGATEDAHFRVRLGPGVVSSLKRVGVSKITEHFEGKRVTVRGQSGFMLPPSIHAQSHPTIFLEVGSIDNFDSVVAAQRNDSAKAQGTWHVSPFEGYPVPQ